MSLNWKATNTPAFAALAEERETNPDATYTDPQRSVLDMLIWGCLLLDLRGIKDEEAAEEFVFRARFAKALDIWAYAEVPAVDDLREWVGLTTNVSGKTRHQYIQKASKQVREDIERQMKRERAAASA